MRGIKVLSLTVFLLLFAASAATARMVSIKARKVNLRAGPGKRYEILWELGRGFPLKVLKKKGGWLKVRDFENDEGWVLARLTGRVPHLVVKRKRINIRSGPGKRYRLVGKANYGVVFRTLKRKGAWVKVKHENGTTGWVLRKLLWGW
jgi:SH3-like domain-containing protein